MRSMMKLFVLLSVYAWVQVIGAQPAILSENPLGPRVDAYNPKGWVPYVSLGAGFMDRNDELKTEGAPVSVSAKASHYFSRDPYVMDFGVGFMNQFVPQQSRKSIQALLLSYGVKRQLERRWSIGPVWHSYMGAGSRLGSNTANWTSFVGLEVAKEWVNSSINITRVGLKAMTDVGIPNHVANVVSLEVSWGFGGMDSSTTASAW